MAELSDFFIFLICVLFPRQRNVLICIFCLFFQTAECFIFHYDFLSCIAFLISFFVFLQTAECSDSEIAEIFGPSLIGITIILIFYLSSWNCEVCRKGLHSNNTKQQINLKIRNLLAFFSCYLHVYALYRALLKIQFPNIKLRIQYESQR